MGTRKFTNNANSTLAAGIAAGDTICDVATGEGAKFPSLAAGEFFLATIEQGGTTEIVKVTARSTDQLTIVRAQEGTTAAVFSAGAAIELRWTADAAQKTCYLDGDNAFTGRNLLAKGADLASGTTVTPGSDGNYFVVTGTATINGLAALQAGAEVELRFAGACTLTHNATSFILQGGTNYTTAAGDVLRFRSEGAGNWREVNRHTASPTATTHEMLSATHTDSAVGSVARGDIMVGNSTPKWARKALGSANQVLYSDGTDLLYGLVKASMLSTSTGSAVSGAGGQIGVAGNAYTFAPSCTSDNNTTQPLWNTYNPSTDPNDQVMRFAILGVGTSVHTVRWRYVNASANPTIWIAVDPAGTIVGAWESEDPVPGNLPGLTVQGAISIQVHFPDHLRTLPLTEQLEVPHHPASLGLDDRPGELPRAGPASLRLTIGEALDRQLAIHPELAALPRRLARYRQCCALRALAAQAGKAPARILLEQYVFDGGATLSPRAAL